MGLRGILDQTIQTIQADITAPFYRGCIGVCDMTQNCGQVQEGEFLTVLTVLRNLKQVKQRNLLNMGLNEKK